MKYFTYNASFSDKRNISYNDAVNIYNSLNDKEKNFVSPNSKYANGEKESLLFRTGNKNCFVDVYKDINNNRDDIGFVIIATNPKFRGMGLGEKYLKEAINLSKDRKIKGLIYRFDNENIPSASLISKFPNFKMINKNNKNTEMFLDLS